MKDKEEKKKSKQKQHRKMNEEEEGEVVARGCYLHFEQSTGIVFEHSRKKINVFC